MDYFDSFYWQHYLLLFIGLTSCVTDLIKHKIYNVFTYPSIVAGLVFNGPFEGRLAIVGLLVVLLPFGIAYMKGMIGGGDVKLFAAIGAIGGFPYIMHFLFSTFLFAVLYALILIVWKKGAIKQLALHMLGRFRKNNDIKQDKDENPPVVLKYQIPLGVFSLIGVLTTLQLL